MGYIGPAFNTYDVEFQFDDLALDTNDILNNGDILQYDSATSLWNTVQNLTIPGNLIVNGTTTTVNSTTVSIDDPIFTLGGDTAPAGADSLDRGIEFRWHDGANAKTGFFGFDNGTGSFTYIPDATNTNEVFSGTPGSATFYDATFSGNTAIKLPVGTTLERPTALQGHIRYNTDSSQFEGYNGSNWSGLGGVIDVDQDTYISAEDSSGSDNDELDFYTGGVIAMSIGNDQNVTFSSTGAITIPVGTTAERPSSTAQGMIRYNTTDSTFEGYDGTNWGSLGGVKDADQDTYIEAEESADDDTLRFYTAGTERMSINSTGQVKVATEFAIDGVQVMTTAQTSTTATTQTAIDSWPLATYRSAKYVVQAVDTVSSEFHVTEVMVVHDDTTAYATEYGTVYTGSAALATYDVDVSGADVRLLATPASTNSTDFKITRNAINTISGTGGGSGGFSWGGDRALVFGGSSSNTIQYFDITTPGNASSFGTLTYNSNRNAAISNGTRCVICGYPPTNGSVLEYVTSNTLGNSIDFGDLTTGQDYVGAVSDATYGVIGSKYNSGAMEYITIATTGNAVSFGNLDTTNNFAFNGPACGSDGTYGIFAGSNGTNALDDQIQYITIATTGNSTNFGQLSVKRDFYTFQKVSDSTRTVMGGGNDASGSGLGYTNIIDYITTATTGNATDFGDLTVGTIGATGTSNGTTGVWTGGFTGSVVNTIQSVTIQTASNATDFGDLTGNKYEAAATSGSPS